MRNFILAIMLFFSVAASGQDNRVESDMFSGMRDGDKAALVVVHSGTVSAGAEQETIVPFNQLLKTAFPDMDFREAWSSRAVVRQMASLGLYKKTPAEVLAELRRDGYTHVLIQSSDIVDGDEMDVLRREAARARADFKCVRIGEPLFHSVDDYSKVAELLGKIYTTKKTANVFLCFGSPVGGNESYAMFDYVLHDQGFEDSYVAVADGYPSLGSLLKLLKRDKQKRINLIPCVFVADDAFRTSVLQKWQRLLLGEGYKVNVIDEGIGELPEIRNIFLRHAEDAKRYRTLSASEIKMRNAVGAE